MVNINVIYLRLHPATRFRVLKGLLDDFTEILETPKHNTSVNIIEGVRRVEPVFFSGVIDHESDIRGNP
jgi:hypothetical protein